MRTRVLLADDHMLLLEGLQRFLEPRCEVVGVASNGHAAFALAEKLQPDVIIADIYLKYLSGLEVCERLSQTMPQSRMLFLTGTEDVEMAEEAIRRGAFGYLLKRSPAAELFKAIEIVATGRIHVASCLIHEPIGLFVARAESRGSHASLTPRQREVLQLLAEGKTMKETADMLRVTPRTVAFHKYSMMEHLGIRRNSSLVRYASDIGLCRKRLRAA